VSDDKASARSPARPRASVPAREPRSAAREPRASTAAREPRSVVSAETQARILDGAEQAFGELGYAKVRVEDILQAAGVSRPTFYKVYPSKEQVFEALSARHHHDIRQRIQRAAEAQPGAVARLAAVVDTFLRWRASLGPLGRALDVEARTPGSGIAHHRKHTLKLMVELAQGWLIAEGRPPVDPVLLLALIAAMESVADSLLLANKISEAAIGRANWVALRIVAAALANAADPLPAIPPPPARKG
jgi:AcrR family transcriptional regulator